MSRLHLDLTDHTGRAMSRRHALRLVAVAGLGVLALAACGGGTAASPVAGTSTSSAATGGGAASAATSTGAGATTGASVAKPAAQVSGSGAAAAIRFEMYSDKTNFDKWRELAANLAKQEPSLQVTVAFITDSYTKYETEMAGGTPPDIMEFESKRMPTFASRKTLYDLTALAARSTTVKAEDFYTVDWDRSQWNGKLYIYPYESKPAVIFYNKALFDNKQVPYPKYNWADPKWTWDEFLSVAQKLSGSGAEQTFGYYHPTWWVYAQPYIWSNGGHMLDDQRTKSMLDVPEDQTALQLLQDLIFKYRVAAGPADVKAGADKMFYAGRIGMYFNNNGWAPTLALQPNLQWDVAPVPLPPGKSIASTRAPADGYAVAAATKQIDAVWKAIDFLGSAESAKRAEGVPSRKAVADSGDYALAKQPGINWKNYPDGLANARDEPVTTEFQEMDSMWGKQFDPYWQNKRTPKELAEAIAAPTVELLNKAIRS